jgi:hypothetical protein
VWDWDLIRVCGENTDEDWLSELFGKIGSKVDDALTCGGGVGGEWLERSVSNMEICSAPPVMHCRLGFDASDIQEHAGMDHTTYKLKEDHHVFGLFERLNLGMMETSSSS